MLRALVEKTKYEAFLVQRHKEDADTRWENVQGAIQYMDCAVFSI